MSGPESPGRISLPDAASQRWDAIVVGTGVGGATFGLAMARAGKRVLFCERGLRRPAIAAQGDAAPHEAYPESSLAGHRPAQTPMARAVLRRAGRQADALQDESSSGQRHRSFIPFIGEGSGGSSALYGMAMERLFPGDFRPRGRHPSADAYLPEQWPISPDELAPWYAAAERLYGVHGSPDPLSPWPDAADKPAPPPLDAGHQWLSGRLSDAGLHPYRLPMACRFTPGCGGCQGFLCPRACKQDANNACLEPALTHHGARLLEDALVTRVEARGRRVTGVHCLQNGASLPLHGDIIVLAAGALHTPVLLLNSASEDHPTGLGNGSGLVGRMLMRHCIDLYALRVPRDLAGQFDNRQKMLAFNDFYDGEHGKLGTVQSFGRLPPVEMLLASLHEDVLNSSLRLLAPAVPLARPLMAPMLRDLLNRHLFLATTLEDMPHPENRVLAPAKPGSSARFSYRMHDLDRSRTRRFRELMHTHLQGTPYRRLNQAANNQRIAHACGTCRFGHSPRDSVLDANNRSHELDNLFVVDASFFPSSGGTNPSLTIAANALRVAARILS